MYTDVSSGKFDRDASRYHANVYQRKRQDLLSSLHSTLSPLFLGQLKNLHKTATATFVKDITAGLKEQGYDFAEVVEKGKARARERFSVGAKGWYSLFAPLYSAELAIEVTIEETDWEYENELGLLDEGLTLIADKCRADETKKMVNAIEVSWSDSNLVQHQTNSN